METLHDSPQTTKPGVNMKHLRNEKGIALAMIMVLSVIALAVITGLIYMLTLTTQTSGLQKRYKTAYEAGLGGSDIMIQLIRQRGDPELGLSWGAFATDACLTAKLNTTTSEANWKDACGGDFTKATTLAINTGDAGTYDFSFDFASTGFTYTAFAKIVETIEGNSGGDEGLIGKGVIASGSGEITVLSIPYFYTIEVDAENAANPNERAKISVLYEY